MPCELCQSCLDKYYHNPIIISKQKTIDDAIIKYKDILIKTQLNLGFIFGSRFKHQCLTDCHGYNSLYEYFRMTISEMLLECFIKFKALARNGDDNLIINECISFSENKNKYTKYFYGMPQCLKEAGVSDEHYNLRQECYFDDIICGHPKASNGWFQESIEDLESMGIFLV